MSDKGKFTNKLLIVSLAALFAIAGCGGGGSGNSAGDASQQHPTPDPASPPTPELGPPGSVSGKITYDFVPAVANKDQSGQWQARLDYANTQKKPARNIVVELVDDTDKVLQSTETNELGSYVLQAPVNTSVRVRAKAQMLRTTGPGPIWNFAVRDNSSIGYGTWPNGAALYAMESAKFNSGTQGSVHDLHAASGWNGARYAAARTAGPFAILDTIYASSQKVLQVDSTLAFPPLNIFWSPNRDDGSYFGSEAGRGISTRGLHIRGVENLDTDEYDAGVIAHEWGHYFQASFSRDDSIGGYHSLGNSLDMRLAFSEGWGNAFSSMARNDPMYVDTYGPQQGRRSVVFKVDESDAGDPKTWFSETAVQSVLYRLDQSPDVGFAPIYQAMLAQKQTPAFTSLFSFATSLRAQANPSGQTIMDNLLTEISTVNGTSLDMFGRNQTTLPPGWESSRNFALPVYTTLVAGQPANICTTTSYGRSNKLGVYRYLRFNSAQTGTHQLQVVADDGQMPSMALYSKGRQISGPTTKNPTGNATYNLTYNVQDQDEYVGAITTENLNQGGCFTVTLLQ